MSIKHRVKKLEEVRFGAKPPFACVIQKYINRDRTNYKGEVEKIVEVGPVYFDVPDGPLDSGKELHIEATEQMEEFRERIRKAYIEAWGCEHSWIEIPPESADL